MSIQSEITRLQGLKTRQRAKLVELGLSQSGDNLEALTEAVEGIAGNGAVSGTISSREGQYTVPAGYHNGNGKVSIADAEQEKIVSGNIRSGVTLLGVSGSYTGEGAKLQEKTVTPTESRQEIAADVGYDGLYRVTVNAIPGNYADVSGVTATAADVLANKTFVGSDGEETAGTMVNNGAAKASIDGLTTLSYAIPAGYHNGSGSVTLTGDIEEQLAAI